MAFKLYRKGPDVIRLEASPSKRGIRKLLSRRLNLLSRPEFERDVSALVVKVYQTILEVQAGTAIKAAVNPFDALTAMLPTRQRAVVADILSAFGSGKPFHNVGGSQPHRRALDRMRAKGLVELRGRGLWCPKPELARSLERLTKHAAALGPEPVKR